MLGSEAIHRGVGGFQVGKSLLLGDSNVYLWRNMPTHADRTKWTYSFWMKRTVLGGDMIPFSAYASSAYRSWIRLVNEQLNFTNYLASTYKDGVSTEGLFRDPIDWVHIVIAYDTTQAVAADRIKFYVDGVFMPSGNDPPAQNEADGVINAAHTHAIGREQPGNKYANMYVSECCFIGDVALEPTAFGEWNKNAPNVWQPKDLSKLDFSGVNSFYLNFADPNDIGKDVSGNGNSFTPVSLAPDDVVTDTPTNNCCVMSQIHGTNCPLSEGNLRIKQTVAARNHRFATFELPKTGKWYWECEFLASTFNNRPRVGVNIKELAQGSGGGTAPGASLAWGNASQLVITTPAGLNGLYTADGTVGASWMFAYDADTGKIWFGSAGVWMESGDPANGLNEADTLDNTQDFLPIWESHSGSDGKFAFNEDDFAHAPPAGFNALMAKYLPEPAILDAKQYFDPVIYAGNDTPRTITTRNKVDHVVLKSRTSAGWWNAIDSVRGVDKQLIWNESVAERSEVDLVTAFGAENSFDLGTHYDGNLSGQNFVAYPFTKSPIAGMDIVTYTGDKVAGRQVPHNIGVAPDMMFVKQLTGNNWIVYFRPAGATHFGYLDLTNAFSANSGVWNNTHPDASVFTLGNNNAVNNVTTDYIAYLFASIPGFSKVFSYTGNGSTNGVFVHLGFKPAFILRKPTGTGGWGVWDNQRNPYNPAGTILSPDASSAEGSSNYETDFLSNGFKARNTAWNANGSTYVGIAFAEHPFGRRGL